MKLIYKVSLLILGVLFLSHAQAETCKEQYNGMYFDGVSIWKDNMNTVYCYYSKNCEGSLCPSDIYVRFGFEPADGPWRHDARMSSCKGPSSDCRFKKVEE